MPRPDITSPWELWVLRGFDPGASAADVAALAEARGRQGAWERALFARLAGGDTAPLEPGRRLLADRPALKAGLVLTMHLGPYQLVLEPFLAAGLRLHLLITAAAARRLRPAAARLAAMLGHEGRLVWLAADDPGTPRALLRALRDGHPIVAFADGNQGRDGLAGTRRDGIPYALPGRRIRVRTGLARFACRTGCPVHPVSLRWSDDGRAVTWRSRPTQRWSRGDDPAAVARRLYDWVFAEVAAAPAQWSYWPMLGEAAECFAAGADPDESEAAAVAREDFRRTFTIAVARAAGTTRVHLDTELSLWPGDILVAHADDHFYAAGGLTGDDLVLLRAAPTLADLLAARGGEWVATHVLRLCLLGLARLRARAATGAV